METRQKADKANFALSPVETGEGGINVDCKGCGISNCSECSQIDFENCKHEKTQLIEDLGLEACCKCGLILIPEPSEMN